MSRINRFLSKRVENPKAEMNFLDHIEELRWHILRSAVAIVLGACIAFWKVEWIFDHIILGPAHKEFISYKWFCALGRMLHSDSFCMNQINMKFQNTAVTGQFMMSLSVSTMIGFVGMFPYVLWELWKFIKPALRATEIKMARGIVFWCSLLFFMGVCFAYFIVAPYTINFFGNYSLSPLFENIITIDNYYDTMSNLILALGAVFQLPMLVYFLSRIGILTPEFLRARRRYAFLILFILAMVIAPPDVFSCLLIFVPLYILFEISVAISGRAVKARKLREIMKQQNGDI
ncbi:twin-arginine translocase subunit TatC [Nemorincola caseinilytica]|uniref:Sec-independent protein translocase protein TatC n=1 Tax=Nemorincola caseinilytica TaxID=2054315 RepID=A0ABP8NAE8_9BACT